MAQTINWSGVSGQSYTYNIYELSWDPTKDQDGNYIFAKEVPGGWHAVYVGEGDLRDRKDAAVNDGCVTRKGATHYHCHLNVDDRNRKAEETDVVNGNQEAYAPTGCNIKPGG